MEMTDYFKLIDDSEERRSLVNNKFFNVTSPEGDKLYSYVKKIVFQNEPSISAKDLVIKSKDILERYLDSQDFIRPHLGK